MLRRALIVIAVSLPARLTGQTPAGDSADAVMIAFINFANLFGGRLVAALDSIPAARYGYRPTASQQSIGYIAQHLEDANYALCERLGDKKHPTTRKDSLADTLKARWPKDTLVARLRASLRFCDTVFEHMGKLESTARASTLLLFETDLAEHYSQVAVYMRLLGMVPPSALPPKRRTAIELPASALSPYVGTYQLTPELQFDVRFSKGALFITPTVGTAVQLWPESNSAFFIKDVDAQITFTRDAKGAVTGFILHQYGRDRAARKIQ
jgi:uncharacterized damage-inducible protein DinB